MINFRQKWGWLVSIVEYHSNNSPRAIINKLSERNSKKQLATVLLRIKNIIEVVDKENTNDMKTCLMLTERRIHEAIAK